MKTGEWDVHSCLAGKFRLDGGAMFGVVPKTIWQKLIPADEYNRIPMALRTMVIAGEKKKIVVDSGSGEGYGEKLDRIYAFESRGGVGDALSRIGLSPEDITDVIVTHLHFDHGGGLVTPSGGGWELTFPNAVHHVHEAQWTHALSPSPRDKASYFRERIEIIEERGVLELHDGPWAPAPGLEVRIVEGHTPGQQLVKVSGKEGTIFYCGDLIPTSAHIHIPYIMAYDLDPVQAMKEKEELLEEAVAGNWILFFEHDPEIEACRVRMEGEKYARGESVSLA